MVVCGASGCSWEGTAAAGTRGLNRHRASCQLYKKSSFHGTLKRQERAKDAALLAHLRPPHRRGDLSANTSHVMGRPRQIAPHQLLVMRQRQGPAAHVLDTSEFADSQHSLDHEIPQNDVDIDMEDGFSFKEPARPTMRRIPRSFDETVHSEEDLNYSESGQSPPTQNPTVLPAQSRFRRVLLTLRDTLQTPFNSFGLSRLYPRRPSFEPDGFVPSSLLGKTCPTAPQEVDSPPRVLAPPYPFHNMTIYRLMSWMNSGSSRISETKVATLVKDVLLADDFDREHLQRFSVRQSLRELDKDESGNRITFPDDWIETNVTIEIPTKSKEDRSRPYSIPGFHYRPLVEVIRAAFTDAQARAYHLFPFKRMWKDPLDDHEERIYDELYTSDAWLEAQDDLHKQPKESGCSLERVIAGLMFFSDATHLANFGTAKAWPLYAYFGNLTKYLRSSPTSGSCHLVGFLPSLPDNIKDVLSSLPRISKTGLASLHTHCRRELFHACWEILLDADFLYVYRHGFVVKCADGVMRRIYPRIFTYSADYPEKVLIATIKDMGLCPCPRCLTPKGLFGYLGLAKDMKFRVSNLRVYVTNKVAKAREFIYGLGHTVDGGKVKDALEEGSWVPVLNQFVNKLGPLGLDPFRMLVVDLMHECELGTWKALFTHLLRLLYALPGGVQLVATFDERFRQVPTFGSGVIRKFANNTSEMKKLAARDFEDILQCAIPIFEGLFPPNIDAAVQSLLYRFAEWHALVKLRLHSDSTLTFLEETFKKLSRQLRKFRTDICTAFDTLELPKERAARQKKLDQRSETHNVSPESTGPKVKKFNLNTYKYHAMGDYVGMIRFFGTTDSFTTQIGELAHRALKAFYPLTNKQDTSSQLAKHERRRRVLRRIAEAEATTPSINQPPVQVDPGERYHIACNRNNPVALFTFLREHDGDPALKTFIPKLKDHILYRLRKLDVSHCDHSFTDEEHNSVIIPNDTIYSVHTMQVHYTTYDMRREYDTINPKTHADVMVLSGETRPTHPYWYARVLGIFHMETWINDGGQPVKQHLEALWVRWLAPLRNHKSGTKHARLPKVAFVEESDADAFGFLDPGQVIRGVHLIPAFVSGRGVSSLRHGKSFARPEGELDDWEVYCVGMFVDRDMFMRYTHLGVGHPAMLRNITKDCLGFKSPGATVISESDEADTDCEGNSDEECSPGCSDAEEESDEEISDDETGDEDSDSDEGGGDDDDDDDLPSF
ncbi:hypothetical protein P692DRAFT_201872909 [Suillus brevipes Sb2]|nr:hypothetical protein P692DRAFT_201872909 [Suillus brevipes Sb2]